jgi:hypothetical protein
MPRFLIDVNLPYRFALWSGEVYVQRDGVRSFLLTAGTRKDLTPSLPGQSRYVVAGLGWPRSRRNR